MRRGDVVLIAVPGGYGKPRPAVVIQTDLANETHASFVVCPMTSYIQDAPLFRLDVVPTAENGLKKPSQVMVDKIVAVRREKVRQVVGKLDDGIMIRINRSLVFWLGLV